MSVAAAPQALVGKRPSTLSGPGNLSPVRGGWQGEGWAGAGGLKSTFLLIIV